MSKKSKKILVIVVALLAIITFLIVVAPTHDYSSKIHNVIEVKDSEAQPSVFQTNLTLKEDGKYQISADWWQDETPGFVTGLIVYDEAGTEVFSVTGGMLNADSSVMDLKKGKYAFKFTCLGSVEAYNEYARANFSDGEIADIPADFFKPGSYEMDYEVRIAEAMGNAYIIYLLCGVAVGLLLVALIIIASRKDEIGKKKYDERQIAAQGMAYKLAFYTMLVYYALLMILFGAGVSLPVDNALLVFFGIALSAAVFATYAIAKDAYFSLNENSRSMLIMFSLMAVANILLGVLRIVSGEFMEDGVVTFTSAGNLICGVMLAYILAVIVIKGITDKEED